MSENFYEDKTVLLDRLTRTGSGIRIQRKSRFAVAFITTYCIFTVLLTLMRSIITLIYV